MGGKAQRFHKVFLPGCVTSNAQFSKEQHISVKHTPEYCFLVADGYTIQPSAFEDTDGEIAVFLQRSPYYQPLVSAAHRFEPSVSLPKVSLADFFSTIFERQKSAGILCSLFCEETGHSWMEVRKCPTITQIPARSYVETHYHVPMKPKLNGITYYDRLNGQVLVLPSLLSEQVKDLKPSLRHNEYDGCVMIDFHAPARAKGV